MKRTKNKTVIDHVYLQVITKFDAKEMKSLNNLFKAHGPHRFEAALTDIYEQVCIQEDGDLLNASIRRKFIDRLRKLLKIPS